MSPPTVGTTARPPGTDPAGDGPLDPAAFGHLPDLESLRLLVLVASTGSLGSAAARLGIAQPSASKRLSALERRLGLVLLDRSRRGSRLTDAGAAVVDQARRVLLELDRLVSGAAALRGRRDAELKVAASMTVAEYLLPAWIGELRRRRPDLQVSLRVTNSEHVPELVRTGAAGIGFVEAPQAPNGLSARQVAGDRLLVVVAPGHPWTRRRRPLDAAELAATPLVLRERGSGTRDTLDRALRRAGAGGPRRLLELGSATAVRNAVIAGTGPAVMSELAVRTAVADGRLVEVETEGIDMRRSLRAVWPSGRTPAGPAADLLACVRSGL
ncbi:LysR family transcriptional regulator [Streptomyces sp. NRRL B-24484]|uniref:LysR family transcriptional regulator n=1 Tax=Streptomyces sp. NRRL B-24484 TaxID=1463833 RepID=UPI000998B0AB|nr:LysR family transcriptional regulator [Streptomyces sp. NRRL B-24484]